MGVEEGVGACPPFRFEGASSEELEEIDDRLELVRLCDAGGGRWVAVHGEVADRIWHGASPESALAAYLRESLKVEEERLRNEGMEKCRRLLEQAKREREEGFIEYAERRELEYQFCLESVRRSEESMKRLKSAIEGLKTGRIKVKLG